MRRGRYLPFFAGEAIRSRMRNETDLAMRLRILLTRSTRELMNKRKYGRLGLFTVGRYGLGVQMSVRFLRILTERTPHVTKIPPPARIVVTAQNLWLCH